MASDLKDRGIYMDGDPSRPPLVLLHSIATSSDIWLPQLPLLTPSFYVLRIDLPGHGNAPELTGEATLANYATYVNEALKKLNIQPTAMLGLSLGGMVAQAYAIDNPGLLQALILANCGGFTPESIRKIWQSRIEAANEAGMACQIDETLARWFTEPFATRSPMCLEWIRGLIASTSVSGYCKAAIAIQQLDHLPALAGLQIPTLVIAGDEDRAVPITALEQIAAIIPGAKLDVIKGVAHLSAVEAPTQFAETVGRFLRGVLIA
jgi:3-oxoadipate enol-lactonase